MLRPAICMAAMAAGTSVAAPKPPNVGFVLADDLHSAAVSTGFAATVSVKSPDGRNEIRLDTEPSVRYSVLRDGKVCVAPTEIALAVEGMEPLGGRGNHAYLGARERNRSGRIPAPVYKKSSVLDDGRETLVSFSGGWGIALHARNDGVAWRFETDFPSRICVEREDSGVTLPDDVAILYGWTNNGFQSCWESVYAFAWHGVKDLPTGDRDFVYLPMTVKFPWGGAMCVTESNLIDYPGWGLSRAEGSRNELRAKMARDAERARRDGSFMRVEARKPYLAVTDGRRSFPWRVFLLGPNEISLAASDAVFALAEPCRVADTSWIRPGLAVWNWWNSDRITDAGFEPGYNTRTFKAYIDYASSVRVPYVVVDAGWSGKNGLDETIDAIDLPELLKHSAERGVGLILWTRWSELVDPGERRRIFRKYAVMGVKGFKIDFIERDDRSAEEFIVETARDAAECRLVLDFHGMHKPTGLTRTYPNVLNYEGVHGLENVKWETNDDFPANDVRIVYSRMLAGPMDYTPGSMRNVLRADYRPDNAYPRSQGTRVHHMALFPLYEAPLQMMCDSPTQYRSSPENRECAAFIAGVPTVWDDTVALCGEIGEYAALARRSGDAWYVGAISNWSSRRIEIDTSFLGAGNWDAEVFADAQDADEKPQSFDHFTRKVSAGERLQVRLAQGGGWTARFTPRPSPQR